MTETESNIKAMVSDEVSKRKLGLFRRWLQTAEIMTVTLFLSGVVLVLLFLVYVVFFL